MKIYKIIFTLVIFASVFSAVQANRGKGSNKEETLQNKSCTHLLYQNKVIRICEGKLSRRARRNLSLESRKDPIKDIVEFLEEKKVIKLKKVVKNNKRSYGGDEGTCSSPPYGYDDNGYDDNPIPDEDPDGDLAGPYDGPWSGTGDGSMV